MQVSLVVDQQDTICLCDLKQTIQTKTLLSCTPVKKYVFLLCFCPAEYSYYRTHSITSEWVLPLLSITHVHQWLHYCSCATQLKELRLKNSQKKKSHFTDQVCGKSVTNTSITPFVDVILCAIRTKNRLWNCLPYQYLNHGDGGEKAK